ncbi:MAG: hypothetical protein AABY16_04605 [Nanoarchaeota archaeon]
MANIHEIIAVVSPNTYCDEDLREDAINLIKSEGYSKAIAALEEKKKKENKEIILKTAELPLYNYDDAKADAFNLWGIKSPIEKHEIVYDSPAEGLEPIYFWLLDFINDLYKKVEKITDNFVSSPGSGHFSELQSKATQMQQEVSRTMGNVNTVIKSVLNLVYDLKEFKLRLKPYEEYKKENISSQEKFNQLLSLKQIWLDNVDIRKGRGSINALASGELDFVTLRDAFMALESSEQIMKNPDEKGALDLNERVRRILQQRAQEFFQWIEESYRSLKQRYEIEKNYLRSQVSMLNLYTRWVKPYLKAAQKLEQNENKSAALVTAFNTVIFELVLLASAKYDSDEDVALGLLPEVFKKIKKESREYSKILVLEFEFRSIPQKVSQRGDWGFGGRAKIKFTSYALNDQELKVIDEELKKDDFNSVMKLIEGATTDSLKQIEKDLNEILEEGKEKKEEKEDKKQRLEDINPFKSLFSGFKLKKKDKKEWKLGEPIEPDSEYEKVMRSQAAIGARESCFSVFDIFKKSKGMPSHADPTRPL